MRKRILYSFEVRLCHGADFTGKKFLDCGAIRKTRDSALLGLGLVLGLGLGLGLEVGLGLWLGLGLGLG